MYLILVVILVVLLLGGIPTGVYGHPWGPYAGGGVGLVVVILLVLLLLGRI